MRVWSCFASCRCWLIVLRSRYKQDLERDFPCSGAIRCYEWGCFVGELRSKTFLSYATSSGFDWAFVSCQLPAIMLEFAVTLKILVSFIVSTQSTAKVCSLLCSKYQNASYTCCCRSCSCCLWECKQLAKLLQRVEPAVKLCISSYFLHWL